MRPQGLRREGFTYHDQETHANGLADLDELALVGCKVCQHASVNGDCHGGINERLVQRRMKRVPSRTKSLGISASSWKVSDIMASECKKERERMKGDWGIRNASLDKWPFWGSGGARRNVDPRRS